MPPSLAVFKARLDGALSKLVWWKVLLPMAGGLELGDLQGPFQPKPFCDSMNLLFSLVKPNQSPLFSKDDVSTSNTKDAESHLNTFWI